MKELQLVREEMNKLTGATFDEQQPVKGFRPDGERLQWYLRCPYLEQVDQMYHANSIWKSSDGRICIQSMSLGNYLDWVERDYGEEGGIKAMGIDFAGFNHEDTKKLLAKEFPLVELRIAEYQRIAIDSSKNSGIPLRLSFDAKRNNVYYYLYGEFDARNQSLQSRLDKIAVCVKTLQRSVERINNYEGSRTRSPNPLPEK